MRRPASILSWLFIFSLIACAPSEERYFPLVDGTWRHYEIVTKILDETKKQRRISGIVEHANTDRGAIFILRQAPDVDAYLQRNTDGIFRIGARDRHTLTETWAQPPQKIIPLTPEIGDTWTVGRAERGGARPGLDEKRVAVPVIAPFELDDLGAPGRTPRETDRGHRRLLFLLSGWLRTPRLPR